MAWDNRVLNHPDPREMHRHRERKRLGVFFFQHAVGDESSESHVTPSLKLFKTPRNNLTENAIAMGQKSPHSIADTARPLWFLITFFSSRRVTDRNPGLPFSKDGTVRPEPEPQQDRYPSSPVVR